METAILRSILPKRVKSLIRETIRRQVEAQVAPLRLEAEAARRSVEDRLGSIPTASAPDPESLGREVEARLRGKGFMEATWPNRPGSMSYMIPKHPETTPPHCLFHESSPLPIPPQDLWLGYGDRVETFLAMGREHVGHMRRMIEETGATIEAAGRIMEFGCASGRMIRWLHDVSATCEVWGVDISSHWISWCKQYLSPPFHFAATTTTPHLPFEDRYFGLIYAGSVFTHIDDLAEAWFLELRRTLRPGGRLYITVHDQATIASIDRLPEGQWLRDFLYSCPEYPGYVRSEFGMFTVGRAVGSQVFYDVEYLSRKLSPFFRTLAVSVGAYGHQTGVLLERW